MSNSNPKKGNRSENEGQSVHESSGFDFLDAYLNKPINSPEYLKLLGYCFLGLLAFALVVAFFK